MGQAITYAMNQWASLERYVEHGICEIDNNLCENVICTTAVGKKNWLFVGHPDAGQRSAIIYSIIASCRCHDIEPQEYLTDVLTRLPDTTNFKVEALTPANWAKDRSMFKE